MSGQSSEVTIAPIVLSHAIKLKYYTQLPTIKVMSE